MNAARVTYTSYSMDNGATIEYVMNDAVIEELQNMSVLIRDALDDVRAGSGDPLASLENIAHALCEMTGKD